MFFLPIQTKLAFAICDPFEDGTEIGAESVQVSFFHWASFKLLPGIKVFEKVTSRFNLFIVQQEEMLKYTGPSHADILQGTLLC